MVPTRDLLEEGKVFQYLQGDLVYNLLLRFVYLHHRDLDIFESF